MLIVPLVLTISAVLYCTIIILLPFNTIGATIALYGLIAFWSRLPGNAIHDPTWLIYCFDLIDLFSLIIAINIGGFEGALFSLVANIVPRFCGFYPPWISVVYDGGAQFIVCLVMPFLHPLFGSNIYTSMIIYSILRIAIVMPTSYFLYPRPFVQWFLEWVASFFGVFIANLFWTKVFGNYFNILLQKGAQFDWLLFLFATVIMVGFYLFVFGSEIKTKEFITKGYTATRKIIRIHKPITKDYNDKEELKLLDEVKKQI